MAISIVGTPQVGNAANGSNVTLTFSTAPQEGDYVVVYGGTGGNAAPSAPGTGYSQIALYSGNTFNAAFGVWIKKMSASPDSSVVCNGNGNVQSSTAYGCYVFRGVDLTTPQDATATTAGMTTSTNPNCPSITTATNNAWVLALAGSSVNDATPGTVSGYSNQYTTVGVDNINISIAGATFEKTTAGAENPAAWSSWSSGDWYAVTVALRPAAASSSRTGRLSLLNVG